MYVCICNCITDRQLTEAALAFALETRVNGETSFAEWVTDQLGAGLGCGSCREYAIGVVERAIVSRMPGMRTDDGQSPPRLAPLPPSCEGRHLGAFTRRQADITT